MNKVLIVIMIGFLVMLSFGYIHYFKKDYQAKNFPENPNKTVVLSKTIANDHINSLLDQSNKKILHVNKVDRDTWSKPVSFPSDSCLITFWNIDEKNALLSVLRHKNQTDFHSRYYLNNGSLFLFVESHKLLDRQSWENASDSAIIDQNQIIKLSSTQSLEVIDTTEFIRIKQDQIISEFNHFRRLMN